MSRDECYSTNEKEYLSIKLAMDSFSVHLLGQDYVIETNHRVLQ